MGRPGRSGLDSSLVEFGDLKFRGLKFRFRAEGVQNCYGFRGPFLGVPIIRMLVYFGLSWSP